VNDLGRYVRQVLLAEIGEDGQRRISTRAARVGGEDGSLAHEVAVLYARGAGFREVVPGPIDSAALAPEAITKIPAAREVLAGARAVLAEIRLAALEDRG